MEEIIRINNLNYLNIINNFNLTIEKNIFLTISGPNNCGKTTLLRILEGISNQYDSITLLGKKQTDYTQNEISKTVQLISRNNINFTFSNIETELTYYFNQNNLSSSSYNDLIKKLKVKRYFKCNPNELELSSKIKVSILKGLLKRPKILLIDNIDRILEKKDINELMQFLNDYQKENNITIIITLSNLDYSLYTDSLIIIDNSQIILNGNPIEVLQKDNIINKAGLNIPFMIDLSVKLIDYDLIKEIELDPDRMVDTLWK